jgi:hypothetical protein
MSGKKYNEKLQRKTLDFLTLSEGWGGENTLPFNFEFVNFCAAIAVHLGTKYPWEVFPTYGNSIQFEISLYNRANPDECDFYFEFEIYPKVEFKIYPKENMLGEIDKISYLFVKEKEYQMPSVDFLSSNQTLLPLTLQTILIRL